MNKIQFNVLHMSIINIFLTLELFMYFPNQHFFYNKQ